MATAAAAIIASSQRDIVSHFLQARAVSVDTATTWQARRSIDGRQFDRLRRDGVIVEAAPDRYYLDPRAYDAFRRRRRRRAAIALGLLFAVLVVMLALSPR